MTVPSGLPWVSHLSSSISARVSTASISCRTWVPFRAEMATHCTLPPFSSNLGDRFFYLLPQGKTVCSLCEAVKSKICVLPFRGLYILKGEGWGWENDYVPVQNKGGKKKKVKNEKKEKEGGKYFTSWIRIQEVSHNADL